MAKKPDEFDEAEAERRFEQALRGAVRVPQKKKTSAPKKERPPSDPD
jgi:hypothetical protein